jgi:hypothetical protein
MTAPDAVETARRRLSGTSAHGSALGEVGSVAKKALGPLLVIFAVFFLLTQPAQAAGAVEAVGGLCGDALNQLSRFFSALLT